MRFVPTKIEGLKIVELEPVRDRRGAFARSFCKQEFAREGLATDFVQHSLSRSTRRHTLRGLHYQQAPHAEAKLVSCVKGAVWDVAVDLRPDSPTYLQWVAAVLSEENGAQFYIPEGFAHGFQSLCDDSVVSYRISNYYAPESAAGLRYDDPAIGIAWPARPAEISDKDLAWPSLMVARLRSSLEAEV